MRPLVCEHNPSKGTITLLKGSTFSELLPVDEIEPGFGSLVPGLPRTFDRRRRIDNLFVTETGNLAIAECKLWRNPEAARGCG